MKSLKAFVFILVVIECVAVLPFLYLYTRPGFAGLIKWEPIYRTMFLHGMLLLFGPVIAVIAGLFLKKPVIHLCCICLACLCTASAFALVGRFVYLGSRMPVNHGTIEKLLSAGESLPACDAHDDSNVLVHAAISSDPHWGSETAFEQDRTAILRQVEKNKYDAFFILGDIGERGDKLAVYEQACTDLNMFVPDVPVRLVMGNHDAAVDASSRFRNYFYGRKSAPLNYRIDGGSVHFIVLNMLWGPEDFSSADKKWFESQFDTIPPEDTVIVLSHCFYISSGHSDEAKKEKWYDMPSMMKKVCPLFEKHHVDLVVSGHNHLMDLLEKDGVTYAVCGAMGGALDSDIPYVSPYDIWHTGNSHGFIDLTVYNKKIDLIFCASDGAILEKYTFDTTHSDKK
jgi:UDP-2,3-diacylglucosamine pyrophosphatase LpxH